MHRKYHLPVVPAPSSPHASVCAVSHLLDDVIPAQKGEEVPYGSDDVLPSVQDYTEPNRTGCTGLCFTHAHL